MPALIPPQGSLGRMGNKTSGRRQRGANRLKKNNALPAVGGRRAGGLRFGERLFPPGMDDTRPPSCRTRTRPVGDSVHIPTSGRKMGGREEPPVRPASRILRPAARGPYREDCSDTIGKHGVRRRPGSSAV
ncbi:unnamed protein product [Arctogadus glacialis]